MKTSLTSRLKSAVSFCRFDEAAYRESLDAEIARLQVAIHGNDCECLACQMNRAKYAMLASDKAKTIADARQAHRRRIVKLAVRFGIVAAHYAVMFAACFLAVLLARAVVA